MATATALKSGLGRLAATVVGKSTALTEVAHRAPCRIIPMGATSVQNAGSALAAISSYGGGMVRGDRQDLRVEVGRGARLGIVTQGATRIYRRSGHLRHSATPNPDANTCRATLNARVGSNGVLVLAPDPLVPFSESAFTQKQRIELEEGACLVLVDWFGAGRVGNGERWDFDMLASRTELVRADEETDRQQQQQQSDPFLIESVLLDRRSHVVSNGYASHGSSDPFCFNMSSNARFDAFASVILHGRADAVEDVARQFELLSKRLAGEYTRIRSHDGDHLSDNATISSGTNINLGGRALLGFSKIETERTKDDIYVARLATTTNEDMYRILHSCMLPLRESFGTEFYRDRIHGSTSHKQVNGWDISARTKAATSTVETSKEQVRSLRKPTDLLTKPTAACSLPSSLFDGHSAWSALMLADSGLPTGSFAHSASIESASQLGLFGSTSNPDPERVSRYIAASTRSAVQVTTPLVVAGHAISRLPTDDSGFERTYQDWCRLDNLAHASLAANGPGCRASLDQGHGMLRVATHWLKSNASNQLRTKEEILLLRQIQAAIDTSSTTTGHIGPIFGLIGGYLGLSADESCRVLGYCTSRDMISAAVRLNLIGPMAGVSVLDGTYEAVNDGIVAALSSLSDVPLEDMEDNDILTSVADSIATCSPIVESIHPTHDVLAVRLFRT